MATTVEARRRAGRITVDRGERQERPIRANPPRSSRSSATAIINPSRDPKIVYTVDRATPARSAICGSETEADLARALREGRRPNGTVLNEFMPWKVFRGMTDAEIHALWLYLSSVPEKEFGNK